MRNLRKKLLDQAIAAMIAAIEVYNKPDFKYRDESFAILAINAWELLIKAKWLMDHGNRINALYVYQNVNGRRRVKRNRSGTPMTYSIDYLAGKLYECGKLPKPVYQNLEILSDLRNSAVHFYYQKSDFVNKLHEVANATVKNFYALIKEWFDKDLSHLSIYLMPLAFLSLNEPAKAIILNSEEEKFLSFIEQQIKEGEHNELTYFVAVQIELRFTRSGSISDSLPVRVTNDPNAAKVRLTDDQILDRYPWDYAKLTEECKKRYNDFKVNEKYHSERKKLEKDPKFAYTRTLDPNNPKSSKKVFYNSSILSKFDQVYQRKT